MRVTFACALLLAGCSTDFVPQTCAVDNDCGDGLVCETQGSTNVCVHAADAPLIIGESAPISGTNQALGTGMKLGIELAFDEQNATGGIRGRQLQLDVPRRRVSAEPRRDRRARAGRRADARRSVAEVPVDDDAAVAGNTPVSTTALAARPEGGARAARQRRHADDGARRADRGRDRHGLLRRVHRRGDDPARHDLRRPAASTSSTSARATPRRRARRSSCFKKKGVSDYTHMIRFDQNDSFGQAGYDGLVARVQGRRSARSRSTPTRRTRSFASATRATTTRACPRRPRRPRRTSRSSSARRAAPSRSAS